MQPLPKRHQFDERAKSAEPEKDLRAKKQKKNNKKKNFRLGGKSVGTQENGKRGAKTEGPKKSTS